MEPHTAIATLAASAASIVFEPIKNGAFEKVGAEILDLLKSIFKGRFNIHKSDQEFLKKEIIREALSNNKFKEQLEELVDQYHQIQNGSRVSQNNNSGSVNFNNTGSVNTSGGVIGQQNNFHSK